MAQSRHNFKQGVIYVRARGGVLEYKYTFKSDMFKIFF